MAALGLALEIFGPAALVAGIASFLMAAIGHRRLPSASQRWTIPAALAIGYYAGYLVLPRSWAALVPQPQQAWQWLPYLGPLAAGCATLVGSRRRVHWLAMASLAIVSGALLTPTWPIFGLTWPVSIVILTAYLIGLELLLRFCLQRTSAFGLLGMLSPAAAIAALCIGIVLSTRIAQLAAIAATAFLGCWLAQFAVLKSNERSSSSIIPVFTILVAGTAFTACVDPDPPKWPLLLLPAVPIALSPFARRKIS